MDGLSKLEKEKTNIIQAIKDSVPAEFIKDKLREISEKQEAKNIKARKENFK